MTVGPKHALERTASPPSVRASRGIREHTVRSAHAVAELGSLGRVTRMNASHTAMSAIILFMLAGCHFCRDIPREQKLADCSTNTVSFNLTWPTGELFSIVLGVPHSDTHALAFRGELVFRQSTGTVARVLVSSQDMTPCNWLDNEANDPRLAGYILTWGRTNDADRLDGLFVTGQSYDVGVHFATSPPPASTLWLHWIGQQGH